MKNGQVLTYQDIETRIFLIRGHKVMLDMDLAKLYDVETKVLNRQVKRNLKRFPSDFMFQLTESEKIEVVAICDHLKVLKYSPQLPYVFTEHGIAMLAAVLRSEIAVKISIHIVKTFIRLREFIAGHKELSHKMQELERKVGKHDEEINTIIQIMKNLLTGPPKRKIKIGFH